ncbi:unnamed protein product [Staurois parvus]|uniref:Uncharacterized protein n=1 Tax=Staurois parvus TaxID=386267 RepID=A0ABN9B771_9NEOB|nr:unnamed protein product [Staurois parvus]
MHSPKKKKKKNSLVIHTKLSMCRVSPHDMSYQENTGRRGGSENSASQ